MISTRIVADVSLAASAVGYVLTALRVTGHERDPQQHFQLCTALSMHVRTILHLIQSSAAIRAEIAIPHEGSVTINDIAVPPALQGWFCGVSALFLQGLHDLAAQFPDALTLTIVRDGDVPDVGGQH